MNRLLEEVALELRSSECREFQPKSWALLKSSGHGIGGELQITSLSFFYHGRVLLKSQPHPLRLSDLPHWIFLFQLKVGVK